MFFLQKIIDTYVSFDLETTGLSRTCEIIEIAALKVKDGDIIDTFQSLVKPSISIPYAIVCMTGITDEMVSDAPKIETVLPKFLDFIDGYLLIGHNIASFDLHILNRMSEYVTGNSISNYYIDTLHLSKKAFPEPDYIMHGLEMVARYCNVQERKAHRAFADSMMVHKCFAYMTKNIPNLPINLKQFVPMDKRNSDKKSIYSDATASLRTLIGMLYDIVDDGILTESEVLSLKEWMIQNYNLSGNYPYDKIYDIIEKALSDNVLSKDELDEMLSLFQKCIFPVDEFITTECIDTIKGKTVCLTGEFEYGDRKEIQNLVVQAGAICKNSVSSKTDFVVIGNLYSHAWSCGNYGNKIKRAIELLEEGKNIQLIKENNFIEILKKSTNDTQNKQISLFDKQRKPLYERVQEEIDKIIASHDLPKNSIHLYSNVSTKGKNAGKETSKSICIYEPAYPVGAYGKNDPGRNFTILNFKKVSPRIELSIRNDQFDAIDLPDTAKDKVLKSSPGFHFVSFCPEDESIYAYISHNIIYCLANYKSSSSFGCCSKFIECSDLKKCVHENKIYSMGCKYRMNLEFGKIFYGKNRNI